MRYLLLFATLMIVAFEAAADSPRAIVLRNECDKVDARMGFKCIVRDGSPGLELVLTKDVDTMSEKLRKESDGEYYRIVMRYYDLGGRQYIISSKSWGNRIRGCAITHTRTSRCGDYKCDANRSNCEAIYAPH